MVQTLGRTGGFDTRRPRSCDADRMDSVAHLTNSIKASLFAGYLHALAVSKGNHSEARERVRARRPGVTPYLKTAVGAGTPSGDAWAEPLAYAEIARAFLAYTRPFGLIGRLGVGGVPPPLRAVPFDVRTPTDVGPLTRQF